MDAPPPSWQPRIRHITGVGVADLRPAGRSQGQVPQLNSPRARRTSHAGLEPARKRAPTLAGGGAPPPVLPPAAARERPLVRCFVTLAMPESEIDAEDGEEPETPTPTQGSSGPSSKRFPQQQSPKTTRTRTTSLPPKPSRPASVSSTRSTGNATPSPPASPASPRHPNGSSTSPTTTTNTTTSTAPPKRILPRRSRSSLAPRTVGRESDSGSRRALPPLQPVPSTPPTIPFFISPIHEPSTHPRWAHLERGDFAPWLTTSEGAGSRVVAHVWAKEDGRWVRVAGGLVDLAKLVPLPPAADMPRNTIQWTLSTHPKDVFYTPLEAAPDDEEAAKARAEREGRVMERSLRETRMKKGPTIGALHQLVNFQSVIADTERSIATLQARIDSLIAGNPDENDDSDSPGARAQTRRCVSETTARVHWIHERVGEVEHEADQVRALTTLRRGRLHSRRALLAAAIEREDGTRGRVTELTDAITAVEAERNALLPRIHALRATHAQTLDAIFPIVPIHPLSLLYSILGVPLPIPLGPKDPAPPLTLPPPLTPEGCPKVDEKTTSAALGYAALVVHLVSGLGGGAAGLAYPVTYAGSRSHVRDVVSIMQGPRSFPLYAKGVERYRYEYAVFLLNKDIEMLMLEADIRMLDLRHTLPNLKNLLLTLASPDPPSPGPVAGPGWASGAASRASSRHPSTHWTLPKAALAVSSASLASSPSHTPSLTSASIRSVCPTDTQASAPPTPVLSPPPHGTATSPVPWRARVEKPSQLGPLRTPGRNQRASAGTLGLGLAPPAAPAPGGTEVAEKEDDL